jgi:L-ascorbate metabolism protein UlaG (beta-lactamase superfamily)
MTLEITRRSLLLAGAAIGAVALRPLMANGQAAATATEKPAKKYQAKAPKTQPFGADAFKASQETSIRWLGAAGFFLNSRGTTLLIDPLLEGFDMPIMIDMPILPKDVPHLDAVLITHSDTDHYSVATCRDLKPVCRSFHSTKYVGTVMQKDGLPSFGHAIGDTLHVGPLRIKLTPVDHDWQNAFPRPGQRHFEKEDCCGFWIETPDGTIWATGDSRLIPEQLQMPRMDAILLDYSEDAQFHLGLEGSVKLLNAYTKTPVLLGHWGTVDAPDFTPFNGDPQHLMARVVNPERIEVLAPGQPFRLKPVKNHSRPAK